MNIFNENSSFINNSNANTSNINSFSKYSTLMEYLIKKLEARIKIFPKTRSAIANIYNIQDLIENKKEMIQHFFEIEDDIKQGVDAIRALLAQNYDLTDQLETSVARGSNLNIKSIGDLNVISELNERNNLLIEECDLMRKKFGEIEAKSSYLKEKILEFENDFKVKEKMIQQLREENKTYCEEIQRLVDENNLIKMKINNMENEKDTKIVDENKDGKDNYMGLGNLDSMLAEQELNKKLIQEKIKRHLNNKSINLNADIKGGSSYNADKIENKNELNIIDVNNANHISLKKEHDESNYKNQNFLSKIVIAVLESEDSINFLNKKFGKDFMEKLLSHNVSEDFLKEVDAALKTKTTSNNKKLNDYFTQYKNPIYYFDEEYDCDGEESKKDYLANEILEENKRKDLNNNINICEEFNCKKENANNKSMQMNKTANMLTNKDENRKLSNNAATLLSHRRSKSTGSKYKSKKMNFLNFPKGMDYRTSDGNASFQNTLRSYKLGPSPSTGKVFVNYTSPHGNYFDDTLQKGGRSKLDNQLWKLN